MAEGREFAGNMAKWLQGKFLALDVLSAYRKEVALSVQVVQFRWTIFSGVTVQFDTQLSSLAPASFEECAHWRNKKNPACTPLEKSTKLGRAIERHCQKRIEGSFYREQEEF